MATIDQTQLQLQQAQKQLEQAQAEQSAMETAERPSIQQLLQRSSQKGISSIVSAQEAVAKAELQKQSNIKEIESQKSLVAEQQAQLEAYSTSTAGKIQAYLEKGGKPIYSEDKFGNPIVTYGNITVPDTQRTLQFIAKQAKESGYLSVPEFINAARYSQAMASPRDISLPAPSNLKPVYVNGQITGFEDTQKQQSIPLSGLSTKHYHYVV